MTIRKRRASLVSAFVWDPTSSRYRRVANGQFASQDAIKAALERALRRARRDMDATSRALSGNQITLGEWREQMARHIKSTHLYSAAIPRGGWAQMTQADYGRVGRLVREQYKFLNRFAVEIQNGNVRVTSRGFEVRAHMYVNASRTMHHVALRAEMAENQGMTQERNILAKAEHCDGCLAQTARGWVPIGHLVPIGHRTCLTNDLCRIRFR